MSYQLETDHQIYGDKSYLAHNLKGATPEDDRRFFAQRIPAFGIIDFGAMSANSTKTYTPATDGVISPIMITSVFAFTTAATNDEITFKIFDGNTEILEQKISSSEIPYQFPPPAAWNFVGFGLMCWLMGCGWSVSRAKAYQIELAEYKLQVGSALSEVKKVSDTLERTAESSAIAPHEKYQIQKQVEKSAAVLEQVESSIEQETDKLIHLEE